MEDLKIEDINKKKEKFQKELSFIRNKKLTVDNIDVFIDETLDELIQLIDKITFAYSVDTGKELQTYKDFESEAFKYYDLLDIEYMLDLINLKNSEIVDIREFINEKLGHIGDVITPPDKSEVDIVGPGQKKFEKKELLPRLELCLYILKSRGVNFEEVSIYDGELDDNMVRKTSYVTVVIPKLDRVVWICNEEGNISYIFKLSGIKVDEIDKMTKIEKNELIAKKHGLGIRIKQSKYWRERVEENIFDDIEEINVDNVNEVADFNPNIKRVSVGELDLWRGFWTDPETGKHWGSRRIINFKLGKTYAIFGRKGEKLSDIPSMDLCDLRGVKVVGYCYEDFIGKFPQFLNQRIVDKEGEWRGFWTDPETGKHWGSMLAISLKLGKTNKMFGRKGEKLSDIPSMDLCDLVGVKVVGYCYEDFIGKFPQFLNQRIVDKEGEWRGFWTDPETGKHWGNISNIKDKLSFKDFSVVKNFIKKYHFKSVIIFGTKGKETDGYCYEDFIKNGEITEFLKTPEVQKDGEWKGFYIDTSGKKWSTLGFFSTHFDVSDMTLKSYVNKFNFPSLNVKSGGGIVKAYRIDDFLNCQEFVEFINSPRPETEGEFVGFVIDTKSNRHLGAVFLIAEYLGISREQVLKIIKDNELRPKIIKNRIGSISNGYYLEEIKSKLQS